MLSVLLQVADLLESPDADLRLAGLALAPSDPESGPGCVAALTDPVAAVRSAACAALAELRAEQAAASVAAIVLRGDEARSGPCSAAVRALPALDPKGHFRQRIRTLADAAGVHAEVRAAAVDALSAWGEAVRQEACG